jgi:hypothetical protein
MLVMASVPALDDSTQGDSSVVANVIPASPTLQGIPPELRNKIYGYLATTEPRNVTGSKFRGIHKDAGSCGNLWKQFSLAIDIHPLTMTCRSEFSPVLASTAGQNFRLIVNNLDPEQFDLFGWFVAKNCFFHRISDTTIPPPLYQEVTLYLKLDGNILQSIEAYRIAISKRYPIGDLTSAFPVVKILPNDSSSVHADLVNETSAITIFQAKLARGAIRRMYESGQDYRPELRVKEPMCAHFTNMIDNY